MASSAHKSAASLTRGDSSTDQMSALADDLLRSSVSGGKARPDTGTGAGPSSITRDGGRVGAEKVSSWSRARSDGPSDARSSWSAPPPYRSEHRSARSDTPAPSMAKTDLSKLQKRELQDQMKRASAQAHRPSAKGLFRAACSTDLLFLMDTTGSMHPYIVSAKQQVRSIVADIKRKYLDDAEVRIAVVSYKDHADHPNIQFLDFTTSTDAVHRFLDSLSAGGGGDAPEDVLGGIQQAINASWKLQTRCLVHIADAPPHGSELHDLGAGYDDYPTCGSEPHGLTYQSLLPKLVTLRVNYALLRVTRATDRMALCFAGVYGHKNSKLHDENAYCAKVAAGASSVTTGSRGQKLQGTAWRFEEQQLGTTYSALSRLVTDTISASISRSADRLTMALGSGGARERIVTPRDLSVVREDEISAPPEAVGPKLETSVPQWSKEGWLDVKLELEGFCPAPIVHNRDTLDDMIAADENIKLSTAQVSVLARSKPFAHGAFRTASYARTACSRMNRYVVKSFIRPGHNRVLVAEDMYIQALCKAFALEFNGLLNIEQPLDFLVTSCLQDKSKVRSEADDGCLSLEPYIDGEYVKYNSNGMYVNEELGDDPFNQMAQAFSHFTFERSWGHMLVNDLQGVGRTLTDPSIQTKSRDRFKLSATNLGEESFKFFFVMHVCNDYCARLELESSKTMFISGEWSFRKTWPAAKPTFCCSNKLCRKIVHEKNARRDEQHPDCRWCESCWPQLKSSSATWVCIEPGDDHYFTVNRFYHESQGELPPRKCEKHRERDPASTSAAAAGGSLWRKMRSSSSAESGVVSGRRW